MGRKESKKRKAGKGIERMGRGEAKKDRVRGEMERVHSLFSPLSLIIEASRDPALSTDLNEDC